MERVKFPLLILLAVLFVLPEVKSELKYPLPANELLCTSQFAVANHACAFVPSIPPAAAVHLHSPSSPSPLPPSPDGKHNHGHKHGPPPSDKGHHHGHRDGPPPSDGGHHHGHRHGPPPSDGGHHDGHRHGPPPSGGGHHHYGHHHGQRHRHGNVYRYKETPEEDNCCKWLKTIDNECVCALLAHLPPFLSRPIHNYTVHVDDSCDISFLCAGRLKP